MILGIDPSFAGTGWAFVGNKVYNYGTFAVPESDQFEMRLHEAHKWFAGLIYNNSVDGVAIEMPFYRYNAKTFFEQASLVTIYRYEAFASKLEVTMVHPTQRFKAFRLKPKSGKDALRKCVNMQYGLQLDATQHDISDAIAIAATAIQKGMK